LSGVEIADDEFNTVPVSDVLEMRNSMQSVWQMFIDQREGLFVMSKKDFEELPAIAADALRIINKEFKHQFDKANAR